MVWMHNGRYGVRHFTREKSYFSYSEIKERYEKCSLLWFSRIFLMSQFSESKVLGIYHAETPSKKCENKWVNEKAMWGFLVNVDLTWKVQGSTVKSGHCREAEAGIAYFLMQDWCWVVETMTRPNSWNPIMKFLRHVSFSVFLLKSFIYLYNFYHTVCVRLLEKLPPLEAEHLHSHV